MVAIYRTEVDFFNQPLYSGCIELAMEAIPNLITVLLSVLAVVYLIYSEYMVSTVPQSVPWAGCRNEVLSRTRACIRELTAGLRTLESGYNQVSDPFKVTLALLTASVCSSIERVYRVCSRISDFVLLLWYLKNTSSGWARSR